MNLARREAGQPLQFPERRIAPRIDPAGWANEKIEDAANDLIFAVNEARLSGDVETVLQIQRMAEQRLVHLKTVEDMAIKYADEILRERGVK